MADIYPSLRMAMYGLECFEGLVRCDEARGIRLDSFVRRRQLEKGGGDRTKLPSLWSRPLTDERASRFSPLFLSEEMASEHLSTSRLITALLSSDITHPEYLIPGGS